MTRYVKFIGNTGPRPVVGRIPAEDEQVNRHFYNGFLILHEAPSHLGDRVIVYDRGPKVVGDQASFDWEEHDRYAVARLPAPGSGRPRYSSWAADLPAALRLVERMVHHDDEF
jgi:hypothetical protein